MVRLGDAEHAQVWERTSSGVQVLNMRSGSEQLHPAELAAEDAVLFGNSDVCSALRFIPQQPELASSTGQQLRMEHECERGG